MNRNLPVTKLYPDVLIFTSEIGISILAANTRLSSYRRLIQNHRDEASVSSVRLPHPRLSIANEPDKLFPGGVLFLSLVRLAVKYVDDIEVMFQDPILKRFTMFSLMGRKGNWEFLIRAIQVL